LTEEEFLGRTLEKKDTNPKDAVGVRKAGMSCVPCQPLLEIGLAMQEGARKYGRHNYRVAGVRSSVYFDAALRHLMAWWEGEDIDPDSGLPHLSKAGACLVVIRDSVIRGNVVDDRPPNMAPGWMNDLNKKAGDLIDRLPNAKEPYTNLTVAPAESYTEKALKFLEPTPIQSPEYFQWVAEQETAKRSS
jgi:hypothetical protein